MTAIHANRCLANLRKQGVLDFRDSQVQIHDRKALLAAGEFDPRYLF
jgi:hypothetical protein